MAIIEVIDVTKKFGGIQALNGVSLKVGQNEAYGLIGPNGSGKTTLLNIISGLLLPDKGAIKINGLRVDGQPPYFDSYRNLVRTFQIPKLWGRLTVMQNLLIAGYGKNKKMSEQEIRERAREFLEEFEMSKVSSLPASKISIGQAKLLEFGRAMVSDAKAVLLDEPFAGVSPVFVARQLDWIKKRKSQGCSFLIISHIISTLTEVCDRLGVMNEGKLIAEGVVEEVLASRDVVKAYLGGVNVAQS